MPRRYPEIAGAGLTVAGELHFVSSQLPPSAGSKSTGAPSIGISTWALQRMPLTTTRRSFAASGASTLSVQLPCQWPPVRPKPRPPPWRSKAQAVVSERPGWAWVSGVVRVSSGGDGLQDRGDAEHALDPAHIVVPFVVDGECWHAVGDRVRGEGGVGGLPDRVDRVAGLVVAAEPGEDLGADRGVVVDGVMQVDEAGAGLDVWFEGRVFGRVGERVGVAAVEVIDDRAGVGEDRIVGGPAVLDEDGGDARGLAQQFGQDGATGEELVGAGRVIEAGCAGDERDLVVGASRGCDHDRAGGGGRR